MKKQVHVIYSGTVQGVGFRITCKKIADERGLPGWVKNLDDGRVELVAEGEEAALKEMLDAIQEEMGKYISSADIEWQKAHGELNGFEVG